MTQYQDRPPVIDDDRITVTSDFWPGRRRHIPFSLIVAVEEIQLGAFSGRCLELIIDRLDGQSVGIENRDNTQIEGL